MRQVSRNFDFKKLADEAMCDIYVTQAMMDEVIRRGSERKRRTGMPLFRLAAVAACGVLIFGILHFTGILKPDGINVPQDVQPGIFSANQPESAEPNDSMLNGPRIRQWQPGSPEEAGRSFGEGFLIPSYIPEGFEPAGIYASVTGEGNADSVILSYIAGDRSFMIMEQKAAEEWKFPGFEAIDINGAEGFVNSQEQYTEVYWFTGGVQYSVSGVVDREEAIMTARSMEPALEQ